MLVHNTVIFASDADSNYPFGYFLYDCADFGFIFGDLVL